MWQHCYDNVLQDKKCELNLDHLFEEKLKGKGKMNPQTVCCKHLPQFKD